VPLKPRTTPEPGPVDGARWIPLTNGYFALVDEEDYPRLAKHAWCVWRCRGRVYAWRAETVNGRKRNIFMHREIMGVRRRERLVDHRHGNGLDNRRRNLRVCTQRQNQQNRRTTCGASRYKGVSWHNGTARWRAFIQARGRRIYLGQFKSEVAAARAYDAAARRYFGEFAVLNLGRRA
jgi:hypothetical protein